MATENFLKKSMRTKQEEESVLRKRKRFEDSINTAYEELNELKGRFNQFNALFRKYGSSMCKNISKLETRINTMQNTIDTYCPTNGKKKLFMQSTENGDTNDKNDKNSEKNKMQIAFITEKELDNN